MSFITPAWVQAFSAAVAATVFCWGILSAKEALIEFLATVNENETRSRRNRHAIRHSEHIELPTAPLSKEE